jgi:hypothetical protein
MLWSQSGQLAAVALAGLVAAACAGGVGSSAGLPTHRDLNGYPAALLEVTLVREGECLYSQASDGNGKWLPVWPSGFGLSGDVVMKGGQRIAAVGDRVKLGGGEYHESEYAFLRSLMTADVPTACRGGDYWLVGEVVS